MLRLLTYNRAGNRLYNTFLRLPKIVQLSSLRLLYIINNFRIRRLEEPLSLTFFVTYKCNTRCQHCFYWQELGKNRELQLFEIEKIVRSFRNRLTTITLTGGEPFLRDDLVEICSLFYKIRGVKKINIPTNGLMPDVIYAKSKEILQKTNVFLSIVVSLDDLNEKHDNMRGAKGAFNKAVQTVKLLKKLENAIPNFKVSVQTVISNLNIESLKSLSYFVSKELDVHHGFQIIRESKKGVFGLDKNIINTFGPPDKDYQMPPIEKLKYVNTIINEYEKESDQLLNRIQELKREYTLDILTGKKAVMHCLAGKIDGILYPNGDVALCEVVIPFGNLRDYDLDFNKLWNSVEANKMRKKIKFCYCIHPCNLLSSMRFDYNSLLRIIGLRH